MIAVTIYPRTVFSVDRSITLLLLALAVISFIVVVVVVVFFFQEKDKRVGSLHSKRSRNWRTKFGFLHSGRAKNGARASIFLLSPHFSSCPNAKNSFARPEFRSPRTGTPATQAKESAFLRLAKKGEKRKTQKTPF